MRKSVKNLKDIALIDKLFYNYKKLLTKRIGHYKNFTAFGEDSIRYDFYYSLMKLYGLKPYQIILEQAIPKTQFFHEKRDMTKLKQGRHEDKPEFDLRVDPAQKLTHGILAEFAFFREQVNSEVGRTGYYGKILNEIYRLALLKHYKDFSKFKCLLICVTDQVMIGYGKGRRGRKAAILIQDQYVLDEDFLKKIPKTTKDRIESKFKKQVNHFNITPTATRIQEIDIKTNPKGAIWIWEVSFKKN